MYDGVLVVTVVALLSSNEPVLYGNIVGFGT